MLSLTQHVGLNDHNGIPDFVSAFVLKTNLLRRNQGSHSEIT
jgi:hypothetical protein